ncbi:MAG: cbb3-type cytochrome oxidase assembly protein CcoS [Bacteroidota bacterium]
MSVVLVLIGFSVAVAIGFLIAFIWSVRSGQYDDDYGPAVRILFDDEKPAAIDETDISAVSPKSTTQTNKI